VEVTDAWTEIIMTEYEQKHLLRKGMKVEVEKLNRILDKVLAYGPTQKPKKKTVKKSKGKGTKGAERNAPQE
jgi:hypothetical protein